jgi:hypothetical protein
MLDPRLAPSTPTAALVLSVLLAACGDSGGGDSDSATTMPTAGPTSATLPTSGASQTDSVTGVTTDGSADGTLGQTTGITPPDTSADTSASTVSSLPDTGDTADTEPKFDLPGGETGQTTGVPGDECKVNDDIDAVGECKEFAPPDSFAPDIQWTFGDGMQSWVTPLAGNFTDDNGDGEIDLCDIPDVLLVAGNGVSYSTVCPIYLLDGLTGAMHFTFPGVSCTATPAFADIDSDGLPEIVAVWNHDGVYRIKAFEHDGTMKWANQIDGGQAQQFARESGAIAIHDLDADGDAEIVFNHEVYDHNGVLLWEHPNPLAARARRAWGPTSTATA